MIELSAPQRPKAEIRTSALVEQRRRTGVRPYPVLVWPPELTGRFLDAVADDPHHPLWRLLAFRGLRRGEAAGLCRDTGVDLAGREIHVAQQYVRFGKRMVLGDRRFLRLIATHGLPPIRLHDLRHGSAAVALAGGVDMKVLSKRLGHSSYQLTTDTCTHVLPQFMAAEAETAVPVVPRARQASA
jgi:integrase